MKPWLPRFRGCPYGVTVSRLAVRFRGFTVRHCLVANRETAGSTVSRLTVGLAAKRETVDPAVLRLAVRSRGFGSKCMVGP